MVTRNNNSQRKTIRAHEIKRRRHDVPPPFVLIKKLTYGRVGILNVLLRKADIWSRVTVPPGQKLPPPHPSVIPSAASCLIQAAAQYVTGTSLNPVLAPTAGGV